MYTLKCSHDKKTCLLFSCENFAERTENILWLTKKKKKTKTEKQEKTPFFFFLLASPLFLVFLK